MLEQCSFLSVSLYMFVVVVVVVVVVIVAAVIMKFQSSIGFPLHV